MEVSGCKYCTHTQIRKNLITLTIIFIALVSEKIIIKIPYNPFPLYSLPYPPDKVTMLVNNLYKKKPEVVEANQWFKNGDHPLDRLADDRLIPDGYEGRVVRYFRDPGLRGTGLCELCGEPMHKHGWIDVQDSKGYVVCPGDWVITGSDDGYSVLKPSTFHTKYTKVK